MSLNNMPGHLIRRLHQISTQIFQQRLHDVGFDLTPVQFATLEVLHNHPNIEQAQVASIIAYDRATIGGVIDRLEQKGFIQREVSKKDRRAREVRLSQDGLKSYKKVAPIVADLQHDILQNLDETEQKDLLKLLQKAIS
ncbi:MarR family winged helix-turn-helix transcriptional regulator [Terasakiella pusilla]|uniref:MarR family winged helix-turn-helix transcriptional regulator n=1 Tax=Terasakiella pusilla TaxID=64973 RepID=UPI0004908487|nr:MarR family transcriptional regulator [Terasakiella pusilla]